jgi:hypothetical protein
MAARARSGMRDAALSAIVFSAIVFALVSVDPRVKMQVNESLRHTTPSSVGDRAGDIGSALWRTARDKSMDSAPVLVFAAVGAVLTVVMLRT